MTRRWLEWPAAALALAAATLALHPVAALRPDAPLPIPAEVPKRVPDVNEAGDLSQFCDHLDLAAEAAARGTLYFPVSDFDCPVTFLASGGAVKAMTGWSSVRVVNLFALVSLWLGGLAAYALYREVGADGPVAAAAAAGLVGSNWLAQAHQRSHLNNVQLVWMGLAFLAVARLSRPGAGWRPLLVLGLAMGGQILSSPTYTLYLTYVGLPAFVLGWWLTRWRQAGVPRAEVGRFAGRVLAAAVLAGAVSAFYLAPRVGQLSTAYPPPFLYGVVFEKFIDLFEPAHPNLFVGLPLFVLGVLAVNWCVRQPRPGTVAMTATLAATASMTLPAVAVTPYWVLYHTMPLMDRIRNPIRFMPFVLMMLLGLVAVHLTACTDGKRPAYRWLAAVGLLAALAGGNWLVSPWYYAPGGQCPDVVVVEVGRWISP